MAERGLPAGAASPAEETEARLVLRLFGPMEARAGSQPLRRLHSRKGLWLLALLALRGGQDVDRDWLAGLLWLDSDRPTGLRNLRQSLSDLRLALGSEAPRLMTDRTRTLRLDVAGAFVDALAFDAALARGDPRSLAEAVLLYRGPLLEGCAEEWCLPERQQREQACLGALATLAAGSAARGEPTEAARYLRLAVAVDPYREDLQRGLMEALDAAGNPTAALLVYREYRELLRGEMGAEPAEETTALFQRLREETRAGSKPYAAERGAGATSQPRATSPRIPRAPPLPLTELVGREEAVRELMELLERAPARGGVRLLTLTGAGGIGKTRLALQVATGLIERFPDGVCFVELAALSDGALVAPTVAAALGIAEPTDRPVLESLCEALRDREALLALDNCEHLAAACAELSDEVLRRCAGVRVLATGRQPLGLVGEVSWRVPSLEVPASPLLPAGVKDADSYFLGYDAVRLFVARAQQGARNYRLAPRDAATVAQICRRLDGIPLAIELAAARARAMPVEAIAARLDDRFHLLTGGSRTALPRQQTLRGAIDWSYDLLSDPERVLLRRLSVFSAGWSLEAAEAVCADEGSGFRVQGSGFRDDGATAPAVGSSTGSPLNPEPRTLNPHEVLDLLTSLVEKSLVVYEEPEVGGRYRLLETVRQYFGERLLESGEGEAIRGRHLDHFLALAEEAEPQLTGARQGEWLERLEAEHDNLRAAFAWGLLKAEGGRMKDEGGERSAGETETPSPNAERRTPNADLPPSAFRLLPLRLAGALWRFWSVRGYLTEGRERLAQALAGAPEATAVRAKALEAAGSLAYRQSDYPSARALQEESLAIRRESGDRAGIAASLRSLALVAYHQEDYASAHALQEESLAIHRELGNRSGMAASLRDLAFLAQAQGNLGTARSLYEESLVIRRELGDRQGIAVSLHGLGGIAYKQGDYEAARSLQEESLAIHRELGDRWGIAASLQDLGLLAYSQGDYGAARGLYEESLAIRRELGDRRGTAISLRHLGLVAYQQGDYGAARSLHQESLAIRRELGSRGWIADSLLDLGLLAQAQEDYGAARSLYEQSLAIRSEVGERRGIAASLEALALLPAGSESPDAAGAAARLLGAAEALREAIGTPLPPNEQASYHLRVTRLRELLGEAAFAAAWAEGRAVPVEQAVAGALGENGPAADDQRA